MTMTVEKTLDELMWEAVDRLPKVRKGVMKFRLRTMPKFREQVRNDLAVKLFECPECQSMGLSPIFGSSDFNAETYQFELDTEKLERLLQLIVEYLPQIFDIIMKFVAMFGVAVFVLMMLPLTANATDPIVELNPFSKAEINSGNKAFEDFMNHGFSLKVSDIPNVEKWEESQDENECTCVNCNCANQAVAQSSPGPAVRMVQRIRNVCENGVCRQIVEMVPEAMSVAPSMESSIPTVTYSDSYYGETFMGESYSTPMTIAASPLRGRLGSPYFKSDENNTVYRVAPFRTFLRRRFAWLGR